MAAIGRHLPVDWSWFAHGLLAPEEPDSQEGQQFIGIDRFRDVIRRAGLKAAFTIPLHGLRGQRQDRQQTMPGILPDLAIVGEAANGEEAVELAGRLAPDVIVMDVNMPKLDGIEATRRIKSRWPGITVVGLSVSTATQVEALLLEAGASCYVSKEAAGIHLYDAILTSVPQDSGKRGAALPAGEGPP